MCGAGGDGSTMDLDPDDMYQLVEEHPEVLTGVSPYVSFQATLRRGDEKFDKTQLYGVSEVMFKNETQATMDGGQKLTAGRFLSSWMWSGGATCASLGPIWPRRPFRGTPWDRLCPSTARPTPSSACWIS